MFSRFPNLRRKTRVENVKLLINAHVKAEQALINKNIEACKSQDEQILSDAEKCAVKSWNYFFKHYDFWSYRVVDCLQEILRPTAKSESDIDKCKQDESYGGAFSKVKKCYF